MRDLHRRASAPFEELDVKRWSVSRSDIRNGAEAKSNRAAGVAHQLFAGVIRNAPAELVNNSG
jgi:hypothetical protein